MHFSTRTTLLATAICLLASGCDIESRKFALPEGDVQRGEVAYLALQCNACHSRENIPSMGVEGLDIRLGGNVTKIDSYATLVTSIINPSHRIKREHKREGAELPDSSSAMQSYNETMTVQQLVDLVTMLQLEYQVIAPAYPYRAYH